MPPGARFPTACRETVKSRKRHVAVGTSGLPLGVLVHAADGICDRMPVILACFLPGLTPIIDRCIAGGGFILVPRRRVGCADDEQALNELDRHVDGK